MTPEKDPRLLRRARRAAKARCWYKGRHCLRYAEHQPHVLALKVKFFHLPAGNGKCSVIVPVFERG